MSTIGAGSRTAAFRGPPRRLDGEENRMGGIAVHRAREQTSGFGDLLAHQQGGLNGGHGAPR
jgi:hypothetical protein